MTGIPEPACFLKNTCVGALVSTLCGGFRCVTAGINSGSTGLADLCKCGHTRLHASQTHSPRAKGTAVNTLTGSPD